MLPAIERCMVRVEEIDQALLPQSLLPELQDHLLKVCQLHRRDLAAGWGRVVMPYALARKYPNADREWGWQWQWVFSQQNRWHDRDPGTKGRPHLDASAMQKAVKRAVAISPATPNLGITRLSRLRCQTQASAAALHGDAIAEAQSAGIVARSPLRIAPSRTPFLPAVHISCAGSK